MFSDNFSEEHHSVGRCSRYDIDKRRTVERLVERLLRNH
jgi:hypothetical protein